MIAALPIANYSLLRALTAHLISIVQNHHVNKMTIRNVGIVFSPTLGIPAGVFSLMLGEFQRVFNTDGALEDEQTGGDEDTETVELSRRNSKRYSDAAADELLGLSGRSLTGTSPQASICLNPDTLDSQRRMKVILMTARTFRSMTTVRQKAQMQTIRRANLSQTRQPYIHLHIRRHKQPRRIPYTPQTLRRMYHLGLARPTSQPVAA